MVSKGRQALNQYNTPNKPLSQFRARRRTKHKVDLSSNIGVRGEVLAQRLQGLTFDRECDSPCSRNVKRFAISGKRFRHFCETISPFLGNRFAGMVKPLVRTSHRIGIKTPAVAYFQRVI